MNNIHANVLELTRMSPCKTQQMYSIDVETTDISDRRSFASTYCLLNGAVIDFYIN